MAGRSTPSWTIYTGWITALPTPYDLRIVGAASVTDTFIRFPLSAADAAPLAGKTVTFQITGVGSSPVTVTPTITVKHAGSADNWASPVTDVNAATLQTMTSGAQTTWSYTFAASASSSYGLEVIIDFGSIFNSSSNYITFFAPDLRVTPGVTTGINNSPPTPEIRDAVSDIAWSKLYYRTTYANGVAAGTATQNGMITGASSGTSTDGLIAPHFDPPMYATPTVTIYDAAGASGKISTFDSSTTFTNGVTPAVAPFDISPAGFHVGVSGSGGVAGALHYVADARIIGG